MKTKLIFVVFACFAISLQSHSQFSFGVSPGLALNSSYFGYKFGKIVPFVGFQYLKGQINYEITGEEFDYDLYEVVEYSEEMKASGGLYIPNIGVKYFLIQKNKLQAYGILCLSKPLLSAKVKEDGEVNEDATQGIDNLKFWGGELGFGMEYFFDDNFSLGGEFGLRYLRATSKDTYDDTFYNPLTGEYQDTEIESNYNYSFNPTYSKISLNFYF